MGQGHISLRKGRCSIPGQAYLVTFTTHQRKATFFDLALATKASAAIVDSRLWRQAQLLAWVLMPDHWHGIVVVGDEALSSTVRRLKCNIARQVNSARNARGPVWASAFHDHALRSDEDLLAVARYLVLNPVRAGLVKRVGDYPFWNAVWL